MDKPKRYAYSQTCSRCDGSGDDPEIANCKCDCCNGDGIERMELTEAEAVNYPNATRSPSGSPGPDGKLT